MICNDQEEAEIVNKDWGLGNFSACCVFSKTRSSHREVREIFIHAIRTLPVIIKYKISLFQASLSLAAVGINICGVIITVSLFHCLCDYYSFPTHTLAKATTAFQTQQLN